MAIDPLDDLDPLTGQPRLKAPKIATPLPLAPKTALGDASAKAGPAPLPPPPITVGTNPATAPYVAPSPGATGATRPPVPPPVTAPVTPPVTPPASTPTAPAAPFNGDVKSFLEAKFGANFNSLHAGSSSVDQILKYLNDNGISATRATHANGTLPSDDKIIVNGRTIDLLLGGSSPEETGGWTWNDITDGGGPSGASQATDPSTIAAMQALMGGMNATAGAAGGGGTYNITGNYTAPTGSGSSLLDQKIQELLGRSTTPQATDPDIAKPIAANRLSEQRSFDRDRQMLAERAHAQGTDASGGFETDLQGLTESRAGREGQFEGQLYADKSTQRIAELNQIISIYGNQLDAQTKNQIALEIAHLQAAAQSADLNLRSTLGQGGLDLQKLALTLSNAQANNRLGFDYTQLQSDADAKAFAILYGGGA